MAIILITGATGFIGRNLTEYLLKNSNHRLVAAVRDTATACLPAAVKLEQIEDITKKADWSTTLNGIDIVIHLAARAHFTSDNSSGPSSELYRVNVKSTLNLARQAVEAGVKRFIVLSSIGVNGNSTTTPFTETDPPNPIEPYAASKLAAEQGLQQLSATSEMELTIIRPPLVYGPNAPGNFARLIYWVNMGIPLPFGSIQNKRSLIAVENLINLITICIDHPGAANQLFVVCDGDDLSTTELLNHIANSLNIRSRLLPVPPKLLVTGLKLLGKGGHARQLCCSLQIDHSKAQDLLGWTPPVTVAEGLAVAVKPIMGPGTKVH